jgi:hypothetical protein
MGPPQEHPGPGHHRIRVWGIGCRGPCFGYQVPGSELRVSGVSGIGERTGARHFWDSVGVLAQPEERAGDVAQLPRAQS